MGPDEDTAEDDEGKLLADLSEALHGRLILGANCYLVPRKDKQQFWVESAGVLNMKRGAALTSTHLIAYRDGERVDADEFFQWIDDDIIAALSMWPANRRR